MQTILGANGIIGEGLAKELHKYYTTELRIVGRNPQKVNASDELFKADLINADQTNAAVKGSDVTYLTVGLPYSSEVWIKNWPIILNNTIAACKAHNSKLVYFDNTYMYPQHEGLQTETSPFTATGKKGIVKAQVAKLLLEEMEHHGLQAVICRAPEFYGPGKTKGITNMLIFENIKKSKSLKLFLRDDKKRTLIYTPDASRATALLGNTPEAYGQTWHLPCDDNRLTYKEFIAMVSELYGKELSYSVLPKWLLKIFALFNNNTRETLELLPRYEVDNIFDSSKFKNRFPYFEVTSYRQGINTILKEIA